ncbi:MAG TPA: TolC family protein [Candidatus Binataceae bacterium]|nr:TolC family protein [Candidatus Binataceae bacterium]
MPRMRIIAAIAIVVAIFVARAVRAAQQPTLAPPVEMVLTVDQLVQLAEQANPTVKAARERWYSAEHSIKQAYAPNDPIFTYSNVDSLKNPFGRASERSYNVTEAFQFPGKALLQTDQARRNARIARLAYEASIRDTRAAVETGYYQLVLDSALSSVNAENLDNLSRVVKVTQIAYTANQATQTDFISAEFDLAAARQQQAQYETSVLNDETTLNQLLSRAPGNPLAVERTLVLGPLNARVDVLVDLAWQVRQEILETALTERNSDTALNLAKMEYLPDFTVGYQFDQYLVPSFGPQAPATEFHSLIVGFNVPIFFWLHQKEDVERARHDLAASRDDLIALRTQTAAAVTSTFRTTQLAYQTALLYRDSLMGLSRQDFNVALIAYQSGKVDFNALSGALGRDYTARISYLQAANQFLAGKVALEQTIGTPLPK